MVSSVDTGTIHLTSLLVQVTPSGRNAVMRAVQRPGVSVYPTASPCKLVAMLEASDDAMAASVVDTLLAIPGVLTVSIVAHLADSAESLALEVSDEAS